MATSERVYHGRGALKEVFRRWKLEDGRWKLGDGSWPFDTILFVPHKITQDPVLLRIVNC